MGVLAAAKSLFGARFEGGESIVAVESARGEEVGAEESVSLERSGRTGRPSAAGRAGYGIPLAFVQVGEEVRVSYVRGGDQTHHLENLGFVEGSAVRVVNETAGNLIVEIKGSQVALDRRVATKIFTTM